MCAALAVLPAQTVLCCIVLRNTPVCTHRVEEEVWGLHAQPEGDGIAQAVKVDLVVEDAQAAACTGGWGSSWDGGRAVRGGAGRSKVGGGPGGAGRLAGPEDAQRSRLWEQQKQEGGAE